MYWRSTGSFLGSSGNVPAGIERKWTCRSDLGLPNQPDQERACPRVCCITRLGFGATNTGRPSTLRGRRCSGSSSRGRRLRCAGCGTAEVHGAREGAAGVSQRADREQAGVDRTRRAAGALRNCDVVRQVRIGFADERRSYTRAFARYALELSQYMTIQDVARPPGRELGHGQGHPEGAPGAALPTAEAAASEAIAIDEICIGRGHRYLTVVLDLDSGAIVFVGQGKGAEALEPFWKRLQAVAGQDRGGGHRHVAGLHPGGRARHLPSAALVFDRFHVDQAVQREAHATCAANCTAKPADQLHKQVLKGTRWLLLKNPENLDDANGRTATARGGAEAQRVAGHGLLPQGRPAADLGAAEQATPPRGS